MRQRFRWSEERARALEDIRQNGRASTRQLAKRWGWTRSKVIRFLVFLDSHKNSLNRTTGPVKPGPVNAYPNHHGPVKDSPLDGTTLDKLHLEAGSGYTSGLISEMNRCLASRFGEHYRPVQHDNRSSVATGQELQAAGVDGEWAMMMLRRHAMRFHPEKHGGGKLPGSLKFFRNGLLRDWKSEPQAEITLLSVEKPNPLAGVHSYTDPSDKKIRPPEQIKQALWTVLEAIHA